MAYIASLQLTIFLCTWLFQASSVYLVLHIINIFSCNTNSQSSGLPQTRRWASCCQTAPCSRNLQSTLNSSYWRVIGDAIHISCCHLCEAHLHVLNLETQVCELRAQFWVCHFIFKVKHISTQTIHTLLSIMDLLRCWVHRLPRPIGKHPVRFLIVLQ